MLLKVNAKEKMKKVKHFYTFQFYTFIFSFFSQAKSGTKIIRQKRSIDISFKRVSRELIASENWSQ